MYLHCSVCFHRVARFLENCICVAVKAMHEEILNYIDLYTSLCPTDSNKERKLLMESIHLLYLLVSNDLSTFHAEVSE